MTPLQQKTLDALRLHTRLGQHPTASELARSMRCRVGVVRSRLQRMKARGLVTCNDGVRFRMPNNHWVTVWAVAS